MPRRITKLVRITAHASDEEEAAWLREMLDRDELNPRDADSSEFIARGTVLVVTRRRSEIPAWNRPQNEGAVAAEPLSMDSSEEQELQPGRLVIARRSQHADGDGDYAVAYLRDTGQLGYTYVRIGGYRRYEPEAAPVEEPMKPKPRRLHL